MLDRSGLSSGPGGGLPVAALGVGVELLAWLAALPTHWRFFIKSRIFTAMNELTDEERQSANVGDMLRRITAEYPQLATIATQ